VEPAITRPWLEGDRLYVAITLAVRAILLGSMFLVH
jgi:uncharacterized membrane protein